MLNIIESSFSGSVTNSKDDENNSDNSAEREIKKNI
jgi:hypothetical protein